MVRVAKIVKIVNKVELGWTKLSLTLSPTDLFCGFIKKPNFAFYSIIFRLKVEKISPE